MNNDFIFEPYEKVLVRDSKRSVWVATLYSSYVGRNKTYKHKCIDGCAHVYCIPFKNNEYLLGSTKDFFMPKKGDVVYCVSLSNSCVYPRVFHHYDYNKRMYVVEEFYNYADEYTGYDEYSVCDPYTME